MPICRHGHHSDADDFCDECGAPLTHAPGAREAREEEEEEEEEEAPPVAPVGEGPSDVVCPLCGTPRDGRFCEEDGHDFVLAGPGSAAPTPDAPTPDAPVRAAPRPAEAPSTTWMVTVEADRSYYDRVAARRGPDIDAVSFPTYYPRAELPLEGDEVRIGRRRGGGAGGGQAPHIDLTGPPLDPGVSHLHAVLLADGDGEWSVLDPGSTNGTTINDDDDVIPPDTLVALSPGDRVHVGAYTTLTLHRR